MRVAHVRTLIIVETDPIWSFGRAGDVTYS
jgi:hypothetical protein